MKKQIKLPRLSDLVRGINAFRGILTGLWFAALNYAFLFFLRSPWILVMIGIALLFLLGGLVDLLFFDKAQGCPALPQA